MTLSSDSLLGNDGQTKPHAPVIVVPKAFLKPGDISPIQTYVLGALGPLFVDTNFGPERRRPIVSCIHESTNDRSDCLSLFSITPYWDLRYVLITPARGMFRGEGVRLYEKDNGPHPVDVAVVGEDWFTFIQKLPKFGDSPQWAQFERIRDYIGGAKMVIVLGSKHLATVYEDLQVFTNFDELWRDSLLPPKRTELQGLGVIKASYQERDDKGRSIVIGDYARVEEFSLPTDVPGIIRNDSLSPAPLNFREERRRSTVPDLEPLMYGSFGNVALRGVTKSIFLANRSWRQERDIGKFLLLNEPELQSSQLQSSQGRRLKVVIVSSDDLGLCQLDIQKKFPSNLWDTKVVSSEDDVSGDLEIDLLVVEGNRPVDFKIDEEAFRNEFPTRWKNLHSLYSRAKCVFACDEFGELLFRSVGTGYAERGMDLIDLQLTKSKSNGGTSSRISISSAGVIAKYYEGPADDLIRISRNSILPITRRDFAESVRTGQTVGALMQARTQETSQVSLA